MNSAQCTVNSETTLALEAGYTYRADIGMAVWSAPFCKTFRTGNFKRNTDPPAEEVWVKAWWWQVYRLALKMTNRIAILEEVHNLYLAGETEKLNRLIEGIELAGAT